MPSQVATIASPQSAAAPRPTAGNPGTRVCARRDPPVGGGGSGGDYHASVGPPTLRSMSKRCRASLKPMDGDVDLAPIGALLGDPGRARMLDALLGGRSLSASRLAEEAGVAPSTASSHLTRLVDGGLLAVERDGRRRLFRIASPDVAGALEALAAIAPAQPVRSLRQSSRA